MDIEEIYNQALQMLKAGHSQEQVLFKFDVYRDELAPLLSISNKLLTLPKNVVPTPMMQRKYALVTAKNFWLTWIHVSRFAGVSISLMLLFSAVTLMGYKALNSAPGQTLFAVKKSAEKLRLILAKDPDAKANLQIELAQKRLEEAKNIFNNPQSPTEQKQAALTELTDQTNTAISEVSAAAKKNPKSDKNHPLITSLDGIAHEQQTLLSEIKPDKQLTAAASSAAKALSENTTKISEIKQSLAIAGSETALALLSSDPNSVVVLGQINQISANQITVEKTVFVVNFQTIVRDSLGNGLAGSQLPLKGKVSVIGIKNSSSIIATQISLIRPEPPQVKGEQTAGNPEPLDSGKNASSSPAAQAPVKKPAEQKLDSSSSATSTQTGSNTAIGSFILEDPAPQFVK